MLGIDEFGVTVKSVKFTVDAALLRELGSRLVGKPHIALAELIKNSYDADARHVVVRFDGHTIVVEDDGHGMTIENFTDYWMRVGTTHKASEKVSPELNRPLTGSKGVGRLAAQLLATNLRIESVGLVDKDLRGYARRTSDPQVQIAPAFDAGVDWESAVRRGDLTSVEVPYTTGGSRGQFAAGSRIGTRLTLSGLRDDWDEDSFKALAREIWALQPPFDVGQDDGTAFMVELESPYGPVVSEFRDQMDAIMKNWQGKVSLELVEDDPEADVLFQFDALGDYDAEMDDPRATEVDDAQSAPKTRLRLPRKLLRVTINSRRPVLLQKTLVIRINDCSLDKLESEVRIFNLQHRQAEGLRVVDSRQWMATFGGVHIYDDGFRLPYYGPEDWLHIERDHARRLSRSQLVPPNLRVAKAMQDLPSRRRLFGTVSVSTAAEHRTATTRGLTESQALSIQVSRDRLSDNVSFTALSNLVRLGLDVYTTEVARSKASVEIGRKDAAVPSRPTTELQEVRQSIEAVQQNIPRRDYESIIDNLDDADEKLRSFEKTRDVESVLLGTLATVGMTTLAWEHESTKQRLVVLNAAKVLDSISKSDASMVRELIAEQAGALRESARRLNEISSLFRPVLDRESRENVTSPRAARFIERTGRQLRVLSRGTAITVTNVPAEVELPPGTLAGWSAIFQNLFINAFNAVLEEPVKKIDVSYEEEGSLRRLFVQDTGIGVDLGAAEGYFRPFVRGATDDPRRAAMGLGGSGLGLTIVRMIADTVGVTVRFVRPSSDYSTCVQIEWGM